MGENVNDDIKAVLENIERAKKALGIKTLAKLTQVHSKKVVEADPNQVFEADAHMTTTPGLGLMVRFADCQGALFYDIKQKKIAAVHAGWQGLVSNIYRETFLAMGSDPKDLIVCVGPSIGPKHFRHLEFPETFKRFEEAKDHYNLWDLAEDQLTTLGIEQVEISRICSYDNPNDYYSHRRDSISGRNCTLFALRHI
ncbi:MAG: Polyphenol oxidase [Chlamydiia bacterium]|nr:Polyphenol oxidase [Chlamydiia bacterium]MCH9616226.1 Polyphenol oxidase [Chlamydiia bacterium]MCH9629788.1 Polyphenol oxidase [Chlamydiia bacterium]